MAEQKKKLMVKVLPLDVSDLNPNFSTHLFNHRVEIGKCMGESDVLVFDFSSVLLYNNFKNFYTGFLKILFVI